MSRMLPEFVMDDAEAFDSAEAAVTQLDAIYAKGRDLLGEHFERFAAGAGDFEKADARYPAIWIEVPPGVIRSGDNQLSLNLLRRTPGIAYDLRVTRVELATRY